MVGVYPQERDREQDILINLRLYADLSRACASDRISDTIDYEKIKLQVLEVVGKSKCFLIEKLAQEIADHLLSSQNIVKVSVNVNKPAALRFTKMVGVTITRKTNKGKKK